MLCCPWVPGSLRRWSVGRKARLDLVLDCADPERLVEFWREALDYRVYYSAASYAVLVPEDGTASPLVLQQVPEPKPGKNRMHVDIVTDDVEPEVERLEAVGARRLHEGVQSFGPTRWVTMADPEGNEFCVCTGVEW
jgi:predicted enzyme related to lactoylglutathione lyase